MGAARKLCGGEGPASGRLRGHWAGRLAPGALSTFTVFLFQSSPCFQDDTLDCVDFPQVEAYIDDKMAGKEKLSIKPVEAALEKLAGGERVTEACAFFLRELVSVLSVCGGQAGRGAVSRKTMRSIITHFGENELPALKKAQQAHIREHYASEMAIDHTFKLAQSLAARDPEQRTAHGKSKLQSLDSSALTVTVDHGLVVAAVLVPNDSHEFVTCVIESLYNATPEQGAAEYQKLIHELVSIGGPLRKLVSVITTDHVAKDGHLWEKVADTVLKAAFKEGIKVELPDGTLLCSLAIACLFT